MSRAISTPCALGLHHGRDADACTGTRSTGDGLNTAVCECRCHHPYTTIVRNR